MGIEEQLLFGLVVENGHLFRADNHQTLLFDRMEPTDEDVPGNPASESQSAQGDVDHAGREVALAFGFHGDRLFLEQVEHYGDVMRREAP